MGKNLKKIKSNATNIQTLIKRAKDIVPGAKAILNDKAVFKPNITPISENKRYALSEAKTLKQIIDIHSRFGAKHTGVCVVDAENEIKPLTEGYYLAVCSGVAELPDRKTVVLTFEPHDDSGQRYSGICLTLPKVIASSKALGEFIFGLGYSLDGAHSDQTLVIGDMDAFREKVLGAEYGIEVSANLDTGWLYVTDLFHLVNSGDKIPSCPGEIIRNEF